LASKSLNTVNFLNPVQTLMPLVEARMRAQADHFHPELGAAIEHLLSSGGKRVRPATALLMGELLGADPERLVTLASAIELLHTATLVHDDLIDGSLMRRGIETLNAQWSPAATVLTGDFIFAVAAREAAETDAPAVIRLFAETLAIIVNGELNQMFIGQGLASRENYFQRIYAKTASMFELACGAAAQLSPVAENIIDQARAFGYEIGIAFQIMDDVLDFTSDQAVVGKPVGSDLRQGLITLPALYYFEANPDNPDIQLFLNTKRYHGAALDRLVDAIRHSPAIEQAIGEAKQYVDRALAILPTLPGRLEHAAEYEALEELACYIITRPT
jgi:geranylgeranyl pyrophosphate synthase